MQISGQYYAIIMTLIATTIIILAFIGIIIVLLDKISKLKVKLNEDDALISEMLFKLERLSELGTKAINFSNSRGIEQSSEQSISKLHSYIEESNLRVSNKVFNKLKDLGCKSNLTYEIVEFLRLYYGIHVYLYGYTSKFKSVGTESNFGEYINHPDELVKYNEAIIIGIEQAIDIIEKHGIDTVKYKEVYNYNN